MKYIVAVVLTAGILVGLARLSELSPTALLFTSLAATLTATLAGGR